MNEVLESMIVGGVSEGMTANSLIEGRTVDEVKGGIIANGMI